MLQRILSYEQINELLRGDIVTNYSNGNQERYRILDTNKSAIKLIRIGEETLLKVFAPEDLMKHEWFIEDL
jgi:hypothetical protein